MNLLKIKGLGKLKEWGRMVSGGLASKKNKKRDILLIGIYVATLALLVFVVRTNLFQSGQAGELTDESGKALSEEQIYQEVKTVQEAVDMANWKTHQSQWYGIETKYPENWLLPKNQATLRGAPWEYQYQFRKREIEENNPYIGFDVVIYNLTKTKELFDTAEFPTVKDEELKKGGKCDNIAGHLIETGDYPAEEIYFPPTDDCYNPALFFSFTKDNYVYNFVPRTKEDFEMSGDPRVEIIDNFPEFFAAVSALKIIDIVRPRVKTLNSGISAPRPVAAIKRDGAGRMVCAKKNDKPSKSNKGKRKHLDMECCLDPDEYPNPWCYYPPEKYGKYLK